MPNYLLSSGRSYPLGATFDAHRNGCNFALFSAHAQKVELCLFDAQGVEEVARIALPEFTDEVWHGFVENVTPGCLYGYRVHGPFEPHNGHRFNASKLLLDPYAKQFHGSIISSETHYSYDLHSAQQDLTLDYRDNANFMAKCVVVEPLTICKSHPQIRRRDTIIYELHVKGFTQQNPAVPVYLQGTFAGLASDSVCQYLTELGITSVELLPVQSFLDDDFLKEKSLSNYWGYNSIGFFVPEARYSHSGEIAEFKAMVERFHQAGIEVILDVVYNHTAEGDQLGPTLCFRGIDNASYYRLHDEDQRYYTNFSGCGNTFNVQHPRVVQLICDSLRYWVETMGIDGFRFDLAPILGRHSPHFSADHPFFTVLKQDPVLAKVKLIAEPWDIGTGGYQLGRFPNSWMEWNDRFRDTCRRFWRGDQSMAADFAARLHGSSDIFEKPSRRPSASINFITSHDGFTLHDLVSYQQQQNFANQEQNRDGHHHNFSSNFGIEGETTDPTINCLRQQQKRNLLTSLLIAQGTPMLLAGDEFGNSQQGNNNAYCQDNEIAWLTWPEKNDESSTHYVGKNNYHDNEHCFVKQLIALRKAHPLLNRTHYQHGHEYSPKTGLADISWLNFHGVPMQDNDWHNVDLKCFSMLLADTGDDDRTIDDAHHDDALLVIFNAHNREKQYCLPTLNGAWQKLVDTTVQPSKNESMSETARSKTLISTAKTSTIPHLTEPTITVAAHSCLVLSFLQAPARNLAHSLGIELKIVEKKNNGPE